MDPLFLLLSVVVLVAGVVMTGRRRKDRAWSDRLDREPWAASLQDDEEADDEPLDEEEIRAAEDAFWADSWEEPEDRGF